MLLNSLTFGVIRSKGLCLGDVKASVITYNPEAGTRISVQTPYISSPEHLYMLTEYLNPYGKVLHKVPEFCGIPYAA